MNRLLRACIAAAVLLPSCANDRGVDRLTLDRWERHLSGDGVRLRIDVHRPAHTHLLFRGYAPELHVAVDGRRAYWFDDGGPAGVLRIHAVRLPPSDRTRTVEIFLGDTNDPGLIGPTQFLASEGELPFAIEAVAFGPLRDSGIDAVLGVILMVAGITALAAAEIRRRGDVLTMAAFGAFVLLYGARLLATSYVPLAAGVPIGALRWVEAVITYVIAIPGWLLAARLLGRGRGSALWWQVIAFAVFAPIGMVSDVVTARPGSLAAVNNVLVVTGGVNLFLNLLPRRFRSTAELRVVFAGTVVFMLFALNSNLIALGLLPWRYDDETLGFLAFVTALGFAATRAFTRSERAREAIDAELRTAREIQQSILPSSAPDVEGLRFAVAYEPASSVAGDVYDFIRIDEARAGVLVADVAGHGVPAALIASMVKIATSSLAHLAGDPAAMLRQMNATLRRDVRRAFVTATFLTFDMRAREVLVCNAGHPPPWLYRKGAILEIGAQSVVLGRFRDAQYDAQATLLQSGDRVLAFTDGIVEARDRAGELFGEERLRQLVHEGAGAGGDVLARSVVEAIHRWRAAEDPDADDLTMVVVDVV